MVSCAQLSKNLERYLKYTSSYLPIQELFCGRASFFGVFQGKNIPLIVPAADCRSDAGSALGTSKARRFDFFGPPSAAFRYALKKNS
jgi:hypothetical protein